MNLTPYSHLKDFSDELDGDSNECECLETTEWNVSMFRRSA